MRTNIPIFIGMVACALLNADASPLTNNVHVTTNLDFFLSSEKDRFPRSEFRSDELIYCWIEPTTTNDFRFRTFPYNQAHEFRLLDESGHAMDKTERGRAISLEVLAPRSMSDAAKLKGHITDVQYPLFKPADMFVMRRGEAYEFEIRLRLWAQVTNSTPDYEVWTHFMKTSDTNAHFGVVVSPPVRVKILNE